MSPCKGGTTGNIGIGHVVAEIAVGLGTIEAEVVPRKRVVVLRATLTRLDRLASVVVNIVEPHQTLGERQTRDCRQQRAASASMTPGSVPHTSIRF